MAVDPSKKLETLKSELKQISINYKEAKQVAENCEIKIYELRGAIAAVEDILNAEKEEETT